MNIKSFGNWKWEKRLGEGSFGILMLWKNSQTEQKIATKHLKENPNLGADEISNIKKRWLLELKWLGEMNTPYIVSSVNINDSQFLNYLNRHHSFESLPVIVMEYCNGGDLRQHLQKIENRNGLHEFEVREILKSVRHAIDYLHNKCFIEHRDLKPDNIVVNQLGSKRFYKLTDFGFARNSTNQTIAKSVVGTFHYLAPEVLKTATYKNNVDYWSLGVIAFELMCGSLPFIPHQGMPQIIKSIEDKPPQCIAITENGFREQKHFNFETKIFAENRMTSVFLSQMEKWLPLALDKNFRTRGCVDGNSLNFFTNLDAILESKVLTVFYMNNFSFHSFDITQNLNLDALLQHIENSTKLTREKMFLLLPTGHPRYPISDSIEPMDLYVGKWQDTSDPFNPVVMLYLVGYQCDYNAVDPYISPFIKKCLSLDDHDIEKLPKWLVQNLEQQTHFLISNEQLHLKAYLIGLKEFALTIEHEILNYNVQNVMQNITLMKGSFHQFETMYESIKNSISDKIPHCDLFLESCAHKLKNFTEKVNILKHSELEISNRLQSISRRAKIEANKTLFDEMINNDIYGVTDFQHQIQLHQNITTRVKKCQDFIYNCIKKRSSFLNNSAMCEARSNITAVHEEYGLVRNIVDETNRNVAELQEGMNTATDIFISQLANIRANGMTPSIYSQEYSLRSYRENDTKYLIDQVEESMKLMTIEIENEVERI